jgi:hypothetical protein
MALILPVKPVKVQHGRMGQCRSHSYSEPWGKSDNFTLMSMPKPRVSVVYGFHLRLGRTIRRTKSVENMDSVERVARRGHAKTQSLTYLYV